MKIQTKTQTIVTATFEEQELVFLAKCFHYINHRIKKHRDSGINHTLDDEDKKQVEIILEKLPQLS